MPIALDGVAEGETAAFRVVALDGGPNEVQTLTRQATRGEGFGGAASTGRVGEGGVTYRDDGARDGGERKEESDARHGPRAGEARSLLRAYASSDVSAATAPHARTWRFEEGLPASMWPIGRPSLMLQPATAPMPFDSCQSSKPWLFGKPALPYE